ncbi:MAG: winged helix-turn-helix domain-containing protein [Bacteroidota bacterium]
MITSAEKINFFIDKESYLVYKNDISFNLPKKEFELVCLLYSKPGKVFRRLEIYKELWNTDNNLTDRTIDVHISRIRKKLGEEMIRTVIGIGYKLVIE